MEHHKRYLKDLHFDHKIWRNELEFYKEELQILQTRLEDLAERNTDHEMKALQEQFQNRFIRQNEVIDELLHEINVHEDELAQFIKDHPVASDHVHFDDHAPMRDKMNTFNKLYKDLKDDFHRYSSRWM